MTIGSILGIFSDLMPESDTGERREKRIQLTIPFGRYSTEAQLDNCGNPRPSVMTTNSVDGQELVPPGGPGKAGGGKRGRLTFSEFRPE